MLTLELNDAAAACLGGHLVLGAPPPGGLVRELRARVAEGIDERGGVVVFSGHDDSIDAPGRYEDLTLWECARSSFHLDDVVPGDKKVIDAQPVISEAHQKQMLLQGLAFAWELARLANVLDPPVPLSCIVSANHTNGTFRFHKRRAGESWHTSNLDDYRLDKVAVLSTGRPQ